MAEKKNGAGAWGTLVFVFAIILSASLIFLVEPMFARMVLPRFGGSASVWSVALVFFQGAMLAGYLYAHVLTSTLPVRVAAMVHVGVLALGALMLPPIVRPGLEGAGEVATLLSVLVQSLGLPFVALAANAPLLQAWLLRSGLPGANNPWPLYAASNAGSLGALAAYPLVVERTAGLAEQTRGWAMGYSVLVLLVALAGGLARNGGRAETGVAWPKTALILKWLPLAAIPSAALVAVTAHLSTDVAAAPFLWVAPLALYLLSFIIVFGANGRRIHPLVEWALLPALFVVGIVVAFKLSFGVMADVLLQLVGFFILAMACHARLAELRPDATQLTAFYLVLSAGGMAGGIAAALLAPVLFSSVMEYPLVLIAATIALPRWRVVVAIALALLLAVWQVLLPGVASRETRRSFYGVHTVEVSGDGRFRILRNGTEIHGAQRVGETGKPVPLTYYHEESPISEAIDAARAKRGGSALRIGIVGLGTGSIACLAEPMDQITIFEIDQTVVDIAKDTTKFTFLDRCAPKAEIVLGDARQKLAASRQTFDILVIDAFSSDAIPVHLLTREALAIYRERVGDNGLIVLHISNNHLRLQEVVAATAASAGLKMLLNDEDDPEAGPYLYQPTVAALAGNSAAFGALGKSEDWVATQPPAGQPAWSDDQASVLDALIAKWRER
ncbi:MAG: fused MFS/spermidine synthase [Proteobacteria bacterium]|nr:fused MFS/spermidine synthase [Pseudomonadota bacterium]